MDQPEPRSCNFPSIPPKNGLGNGIPWLLGGKSFNPLSVAPEWGPDRVLEEDNLLFLPWGVFYAKFMLQKESQLWEAEAEMKWPIWSLLG